MRTRLDGFDTKFFPQEKSGKLRQEIADFTYSSFTKFWGWFLECHRQSEIVKMQDTKRLVINHHAVIP